MFVITIVGFVAIFFAYLEAKEKISFGFLFSFLLVTFVQAFHYEFGNDYVKYYDEFYYLTSFPCSFDSIFFNIRHREPGWVFLEYVFKPFGFFSFVAFISILQNTIYFTFIKKYVNLKYIPFAIFIYVFNPNLYLLNMSMLRQALAEALFFLAFMLAGKKSVKYFVIALIVVVFAGMIHTSAYAMVPFLLWIFVPMKNAKKMIPILGTMFLVFFFSSTVLNHIVQNVLALNVFSKFDYYSDVQSSSGGLGFTLLCIPAIIMLASLKENKKEYENHIVSMAVLERLFVSFAMVVMLASRMTFYFLQFYIIALPIAVLNIKDFAWKMTAVILCALIILYQYFLFFTTDVYGRFYSEYKSIFEVVFQ